MKNIITILFSIVVCCSLCNLAIAQGTLGQYPGMGVGFDSGCGYADAGNSDLGVMDVGLAGNACGAAFDVTFGAWAESAGGFDITGFELNNYDIDDEAAYGIRLFWGPQNNCCTVCLDAMLDLGQDAACGTFGPQVDLGSFGIPVPANYGLDVFGEEVIPSADMCPNTEYFAQYQFILATAVDLTDPDGNLCAMDDGLITNAGTMSTIQTLVTDGTRDPIIINSATLALAGAADCAATNVLLDFEIDIAGGCTALGQGRVCSQGMEFEFRAALACADGTALDITTGPLINDPTACIVNTMATGQISLGAAADVCAIFACDPNASLEIYTTYTFCEADDIVGDGTGNDEAVMSISIADIVSGFDAAMCCAPPTCTSTYSYTTPAEVCNGAAIDFVVDAGCDVSLNTIDFGGGIGVDPSLDLDIYVYVDPATGLGGQAPAGFTVVPADMDGATGNPDLAYLGTAGAATTVGNGCGDYQIAAGTFYNSTCAPNTVSFFVVPYSYDYDIDGDNTFGAYLADSNPEACPPQQYDIVINPIFEVFENTADGCDPVAGVFAGDGMGGIFDTNGDGNFDFLDACMTAQLDPTANCTDGETLDYDFSAMDVGGCSGTLTGTLTCACSLDCQTFNAISLAAGCTVIDLCIGYVDTDADGIGDGGEDPSGTTMTVDVGAAAGLGTAINDGLFLFDSTNDGVDQSDAVGYCYTYVYEHQGCDPVPYSGLINLLCPDGTPGMLDLGDGPIALAPDVDIAGAVFTIPGGGAFYPVLTQGTVVPAVCPTLVDESDAVAAFVEVTSPDGTVCATVTGDTPVCDATGGNAAEPVQVGEITDPLLTAIYGADNFAQCGLDETADLSYTCAGCEPSVCTAPTITDATAEVCSGALAAEFTDWQTAVEGANPDDTPVDGTSTGIEYSSVNDPAAPDGDVSAITGTNTGCDAVDQVVYAFVGCDTNIDGAPDSYELAGTFTLTVYPALTATDASAPAGCGTLQVDLVAEDGTVCASETQACAADGDVLSFDFAGTVADPQSCSTLSATTAACTDCGDPTCDLSISITIVMCDNGGTPDDTSDDVITYAVTATGGLGTTWSGTDTNGETYTNVAYGTAITSTMPLMGPGSVTVTVTDDTDATCTLDSTVPFDGCTMPAIPTLSQWGLMSLALLLMIFGALKLGTATVSSYRVRKN